MVVDGCLELSCETNVHPVGPHINEYSPSPQQDYLHAKLAEQH